MKPIIIGSCSTLDPINHYLIGQIMDCIVIYKYNRYFDLVKRFEIFHMGTINNYYSNIIDYSRQDTEKGKEPLLYLINNANCILLNLELQESTVYELNIPMSMESLKNAKNGMIYAHSSDKYLYFNGRSLKKSNLEEPALFQSRRMTYMPHMPHMLREMEMDGDAVELEPEPESEPESEPLSVSFPQRTSKFQYGSGFIHGNDIIYYQIMGNTITSYKSPVNSPNGKTKLKDYKIHDEYLGIHSPSIMQNANVMYTDGMALIHFGQETRIIEYNEMLGDDRTDKMILFHDRENIYLYLSELNNSERKIYPVTIPYRSNIYKCPLELKNPDDTQIKFTTSDGREIELNESFCKNSSLIQSMLEIENEDDEPLILPCSYQTASNVSDYLILGILPLTLLGTVQLQKALDMLDIGNIDEECLVSHIENLIATTKYVDDESVELMSGHVRLSGVLDKLVVIYDDIELDYTKMVANPIVIKMLLERNRKLTEENQKLKSAEIKEEEEE